MKRKSIGADVKLKKEHTFPVSLDILLLWCCCRHVLVVWSAHMLDCFNTVGINFLANSAPVTIR